jgi:alkanesulfonate monooxygenase SsuD/methylene tetrahydromethanopterin reductase-like flavin-dependent oxidoreductase (luciferase family)
MEAWHGVPFRKPASTMRETIEIVRLAAGGGRLEFDGDVYQLPLEGSGRPIRSMAPPTEIPIYIASLGPRSLELTGEIADGWLGNAFMPEHADVFLDQIRAGCARAGRSIDDLDLAMPVAVEFTDDVDQAGRRHADGYAFTIGAMGSTDQNFYNQAFTRQGYGDDVEVVWRLWLDGRREDAAARVPIEIGLDTNLLGTPATIKDRVRLYRTAGVDTFQAKLSGSVQERIDSVASSSRSWPRSTPSGFERPDFTDDPTRSRRHRDLHRSADRDDAERGPGRDSGRGARCAHRRCRHAPRGAGGARRRIAHPR